MFLTVALFHQTASAQEQHSLELFGLNEDGGLMICPVFTDKGPGHLAAIEGTSVYCRDTCEV